MSSAAVLAIDDRGLVTLEVPDAKGEVHSYTVLPAPQGLDDWAVSLSRTDGEGEPRRVAVDDLGRWRCSCPDMLYRRRKSRSHDGPCKHVVAARGLHTLIRLLTAEWCRNL